MLYAGWRATGGWRPTISDVVRYCVDSGIELYLLRGKQLNGLSQANMYGDDCYPATNYPLVRLRSALTHEVYFCRTSDFSAMAVATGASLQSVRFDAANVPYGTYELSVIANGISSHVIDFCHRRHEQRCGCGKTEGCCCRGADPCCREEVAMDPQFIRLNQQLKRVQNALRRLGSPVIGESPARQPKEGRKANKAEQEAADREAAEERPRRVAACRMTQASE